jgi:O-antigen/teichoic acid export membrane protein
LSLRRAVVANYGSQIYSTLLGIALVPVYLRYLGAEAYGLVGVFTMMQGWFQLLDLGLSPTLAREAARYKGGAVSAFELRSLLRVLEAFFVGVALLAAGAVVLGASWIANFWLNVEHLPAARVVTSVMLMGLAVPLRWTSGLYRGAINGFERHTWLAAFNASVSTARYIGVLLALTLLGKEPEVFFAYQLAVAAAECTMLVAMTYHLAPRVPAGQTLRLSWAPVAKVGQFSGVVAITGIIWVLTTQFDRLLLSRFISLSEYGYFTLAIVVANGINMLGSPIAMPLMPRLARLHAEDRQADAMRLYRKATRGLAALVAPAIAMLAVFPQPLLWSWTGNAVAAQRAAPILTLYALGNGCLAFAAFAYYLQYGRGNLRMHLIGNLLLSTMLLPGIAWAASHYGAVGVGWTWLLGMGSYLAIWVTATHVRLAPGLHLRWLLMDVLPPLAAALAIALVASRTQLADLERLNTALRLAGIAAVVAFASVGTAWLIHRSDVRRATRIVSV